MKVQELGIEEMARLGATHRVIVKAEDINGTGTGYGALSAAAAAATTGILNPWASAAAGNQVQFVGGRLVTAFDGTSTTGLTLQIGYDLASGTDDADALLAATEIHNDATEINYFPQEVADVSSSSVDETYGTQESTAVINAIAAINAMLKQLRTVHAAASDIDLLFTSTTANLDDVTTGEVHLLFRMVDLAKI